MAAIFCLSCIWKYGFAWLASMHSSRSIYSLDSSRSIYSQTGSAVSGAARVFQRGHIAFALFRQAEASFPDHCLHHGMSVSSRSFLHGRRPRRLLDIGDGFRLRVLALFRKLLEIRRFFVWRIHRSLADIADLDRIRARKTQPGMFSSASACPLSSWQRSLMWHLVESRFLASGSHYRQASRRQRC